MQTGSAGRDPGQGAAAAAWAPPVHQPLPGVFAGVGVFYVFTGLVMLAFPDALEPAWRLPYGLGTVGAGLGLLALGRLVRGRTSGPLLDAVAAASALVLAVHGLGLPAASGEFDDMAVGVLAIAGAGFVVASWPALAAVLAGSAVAWAASALLVYRVPVWGTEGSFVFVGLAVSVVAFVLRRRSLRTLAQVRADWLQEAEAARMGEERFRALAESARDAILVADRAGRVTYRNPAAAQLWGAAAAPGGEVLSLLHDGAASETMAAILREPQRGSPGGPLELKARRPDGSEVTVEASLAVTGPPADAVFTFVVRDITERKAAEKAEIAALAQNAELEGLRRMNTVKTQFLNTAAHELNTPITPIRLQLHMLRSGAFGALEQRQGKALEILDRNVERLSVLVQEILDVARLESGKVRLNPQPIEMAPILREAAETFGETARQVGIQLTVESSPGLAVRADRHRVLQVLYNLVSNALKFTPSGGRVTVRAEPQGEEAVVAVHDTGLGLGKDQMAKLFQPFTQVHDPMKVTTPGTGLGLYICRGLIEAHGGRISVDSLGPGQGSIFRFTLPLSSSPAGAKPMPLPVALPVPVGEGGPESEEPLARRLRELI